MRTCTLCLFTLCIALFIFLPVSGDDPSGEEGMVLIPGGEFGMGTVSPPGAAFVDNPLHKVKVDAFYLDQYEVTNADYLAFCEATDRNMPEFWELDIYCSGPGFPDHPVVGVTWADATAFAEWKGKRLPTESEWEYAARGGLEDRKFPSGDEMDPTLGNYHGTNGKPLPVGSFPANGYGLYDMAGNVVEWVADYYARDYYLESPLENPTGPEAGKRRVIRGGGWRSGRSCVSVDFRQSLRTYWVDFNVGFRCAKSVM